MLLKNSSRVIFPKLRNLFIKKNANTLRLETPLVGARTLYSRRGVADPFQQMDNFMRDIEKKFWGEVNEHFPQFRRFEPPSNYAVVSTRHPTNISGPSDLSTNDTFKLAFNFPQAKPEDIKVTLKDRLLSIEAKVQEDDENSKRLQSFSYQSTLPDSINAEKLQSILSQDGVLTIEAPKNADAEGGPTPIDIKRE